MCDISCDVTLRLPRADGTRCEKGGGTVRLSSLQSDMLWHIPLKPRVRVKVRPACDQMLGINSVWGRSRHDISFVEQVGCHFWFPLPCMLRHIHITPQLQRDFQAEYAVLPTVSVHCQTSFAISGLKDIRKSALNARNCCSRIYKVHISSDPWFTTVSH